MNEFIYSKLFTYDACHPSVQEFISDKATKKTHSEGYKKSTLTEL